MRIIKYTKIIIKKEYNYNLKKIKRKLNWKNIIFGSLLTISETLPFIDTKYNGILHALNKILKDE